MFYNEDCLRGMAKLDASSVDLILTDLPYNIMEYDKNKKPLELKLIWSEFKRLLKPCRAVVLFASQRFTIQLAASNMEWYKYKWCRIKNTTCNFVQAKNRPLSKCEDILIFSGGVVNHASKTANRMIYNPQGLKGCNKVQQNAPTLCYGTPPSRADGTVYLQTQTGYPTDVLYYDTPPTNGRCHFNQKPTESS